MGEHTESHTQREVLLDVKNRCWSQPMLDICGISEAQMPKLFES